MVYGLIVSEEEIAVTGSGTGIFPTIQEITRIISFFQELKRKGQKYINEYNTECLAEYGMVYQPQQNIQPDRKGIVYFIEQGGYVKIGRTSGDVQSRIKGLLSNHPKTTELVLLHSIKCEDSYKSEKLLHSFFAAKRVKGEWFDLDENDMVNIKGIEKL